MGGFPQKLDTASTSVGYWPALETGPPTTKSEYGVVIGSPYLPAAVPSLVRYSSPLVGSVAIYKSSGVPVSASEATSGMANPPG